MYDIILWDLDGTLTDSQPGIYNSIYHALDKLGYPHPDSKHMKKFIGPPLLESFDRYCGMDEETARKALEGYREYYNVKGYLENSVYPQVPEALEALKNAEKRLSVATSKPENFARRICDHFGLSKYFEFIGGASLDEVRNNKIQVIEYVLGELQVTDKSKVLMVGDRRHDAEGAEINGIDCMGVLYGYGDREELEDAGAKYIAATPLEAANIIIAC